MIFIFKKEEIMRNSKYHTSQKDYILEYLQQNSSQFVSASDILTYLLKGNQKIGLTTIYRHLKTLEEEGTLRTDMRDNTKIFQYIEDKCQNHFHLKCEKCGKLEHLECEEMNEFCEHIGKEHGFFIDTKNAISGVCKKCQKKMKEDKK